MPDDTARDDLARGLDRRGLIKRAAAAGAVAWTTPLLVDSFASPAAAATAPPGCWHLVFDRTNCGQTTSLSCTRCLDPACPGGGSFSTTATPAAAFGLSFSGPCAGGVTASITDSSCVIVQGAASLGNNGITCCSGTVAPAAGGKSITFPPPVSGGGTPQLQIWLSC